MAYQNTFICISSDSFASKASVPQLFRGKATKAMLEYNLLRDAPFTLNHDDFVYAVHLAQSLGKDAVPKTKPEFLSKGQPCLRASPLIKKFGWGAHYNADGKIEIC